MQEARKTQEERAADSLAALGNRTRLKLFRLLVRCGETGVTVGELQRHAAIPASTLAHHLSTLARAGLVVQERQGREVLSRVDYGAMQGLLTFLTEKCCSGVKLEASDAA